MPIDPTMWRRRDMMEVTVGLGTGNKDAQLQRLWALAEKQEQHLLNGSPLVTPDNLYNTYDKIITTAGLRDTEMFFTNPRTAQPKPQEQEQPDPAIVLGQMQMKIEQDKLQAKQMENQENAKLKMAELQLKAQEMQGKAALEQKTSMDQTEVDIAKIELDKYTVDENNKVKIAIERMKQGEGIMLAIDELVPNIDKKGDEAVTNAVNRILADPAFNEMITPKKDGTNEAILMLSDQISTLVANMSRPKRVIKDKDGRPLGIETI